MLSMSPRILILDPDKVTRPKLEFFASLGIPTTVLVQSNILERSLEKHLVPYVDFLRGILGTDANIRAAIARHPYSLAFDLDKSVRPALEALRRHGLTDKAVSKLITLQIGTLVTTPSRIAQICEDLEAIGLPATDSRFPYAFRAMAGIKRETWLRKAALYKSFGVTEGELLKAFKKQSTIMSISEENIKEKLQFFRDTLRLDLRDVIERSVAMVYGLKKSILPRCAVLSVLMREGKSERDINLLGALFTKSKSFSERFVLKYADDVPDVVKASEGGNRHSSTCREEMARNSFCYSLVRDGGQHLRHRGRWCCCELEKKGVARRNRRYGDWQVQMRVLGLDIFPSCVFLLIFDEDR